MSSPSTTRLPAWLLGSGVIAVAMGVMNLSTYAFTVLAARLLGPREYGALAAVMGLLLVVNVASLGLQATGARRVSASPRDRARIESQILAAGFRMALSLGAVCLVLAPVATWALRLDSGAIAMLIAVAVVPLTIMGGQAGILQGERRWLWLAGIYLAMGLGRVVLGVAALLVRPDALGAMTGVALGAFAPAVVGWFASRPALRRPALLRAGTTGGVLHEVGHSSHALLAFFMLANADVVIARTALDDQQSGLYAGGLILAKAVLFLPQFVVVVAFPSMAAAGARHSRHLIALVAVLAIGLVTTIGTAVASDFAVMFVGGVAYADLGPALWAFAAVGTLLAMIQLMTYDALARQRRRAVFVVWAGLVALVILAPFVGSVAFLLACVVAVEATVLVVLTLA